MTKVGINGFGRIGRLVLKAGLNSKNIEFMGVNDLADTKTLAHLFKYDSTFGTFPGSVEAKANSLVIDGKEIKVFAERDPEALPWKDLGVEIVVESTGLFTSKDKASKHLKAGAKRVIISAPAKEEDITIVMGVNEDKYDASKHFIISNASCTTNCLAPPMKVMMDSFGIKKGLMTTIHSFTNDQNVLDAPHKDLRRARTASASMIPTTTGAAKAIGLVIPELKGKMDGFAIRVPTPNVSVVDVVVQVGKETTAEEVNAALVKAANGPLGKYMAVCTEPLVSIDFNGNPKSSTVDAGFTKVFGDMVKLLAWYDNETGYATRVIDLIEYMQGK
ncbi:MAG: type I glyceraldehyde-3-phosphate dehydrogenase [Candidatus Omnitrophota bacterium]|nr:type I glyceraldehyde-3-phosphate dehydrogenase [Candidatus Omnitrophota bacterium]MBU2528912.1 type I glyceraldehyde-3-phosphate dehydrogenase [bacterium]MBU3929977.1 type I glyceraldehyde-3-phosphate dehydrogenase [bacterium]MBU4122931.1 type I glyceraldehyde-3-phosphate dehydrogenase [bacterium]